jgi:hypothetical protein
VIRWREGQEGGEGEVIAKEDKLASIPQKTKKTGVQEERQDRG